MCVVYSVNGHMEDLPVFRNGKSLFVVEDSDPVSMPSELKKKEPLTKKPFLNIILFCVRLFLFPFGYFNFKQVMNEHENASQLFI